MKYEDQQFNPALCWLASCGSVEVNTTLHLVAIAQAPIARQHGSTCNKGEPCPCFGAVRESGNENRWWIRKNAAKTMLHPHAEEKKAAEESRLDQNITCEAKAKAEK